MNPGYIKGSFGLDCKFECSTSPIALPTDMPSVPLDFKRHILTILQAKELDNYPDEKLKRWFLILEELEIHKDTEDFINIKCTRHFVSHNICTGSEVVSFLKKELPESVYINTQNKEEARFLRHIPTHTALVTRFEQKAREWAINLVTQEIVNAGGHIY